MKKNKRHNRRGVVAPISIPSIPIPSIRSSIPGHTGIKGKPCSQENEISQRVVVVLLIIVLITSVVSFGLVVYSSSPAPVEAPLPQESSATVASGSITLEVLPQPQISDENKGEGGTGP